MNKEKRALYSPRASIHTLEIGMDYPVYCEDTLNDSFRAHNYPDGTSSAIINPNKINRKDCYSFTDFQKRFNQILEMAHLEDKDYHINRCDLRLDTYGKDDYKIYSKFHKLLISLLAVEYKSVNAYIGKKMWSDEQISCVLKNSYFQIENYDRAYKNELTSNCIEVATSRLEQRSMKKSFNQHDPSTEEQLDNIKEEFMVVWKRRWNKAKQNFSKVCDRYNNELVRIWNEEKKKTKEIRFKSVNEFVRFYQNNIFCRKQLIDLLVAIGYEPDRAKETAKTWKRRYRFEWFCQKDIDIAIQSIITATACFFLF